MNIYGKLFAIQNQYRNTIKEITNNYINDNKEQIYGIPIAIDKNGDIIEGKEVNFNYINKIMDILL